MMCHGGGKGDVSFDNLSSVPRTILKHRCSGTHHYSRTEGGDRLVSRNSWAS